MTDIRKLCERVLELDGKATKGPWSYSRCYGVATIEPSINNDPIAHAVEYLKTLDADLIAEYRSAAPILAKALLEYENDKPSESLNKAYDRSLAADEIMKQRETIEKMREVLQYYADFSESHIAKYNTMTSEPAGDLARRVLEETKDNG